MIEPLLDAARRRGASGADAITRVGETTTLSFEMGRLKAASVNQEGGANLRVVVAGRTGVAGTTADAVDGVVEAAIQAAAVGDALDLVFPPARPAPAVRTASAAARDASRTALIAMGRGLVERLAGEGRHVTATVQREITSTTFGSTSGQRASYEATQVAVAAEVTRVRHDDVLIVYDYVVGVDPPSEAGLEALAAGILERLTRAEQIVAPPEGTMPVLFTPHGLAAVLLPLEQALLGKSVLQGVSPLAGKLGSPALDACLTIGDDPTLEGAPASRPVDDEGVPSRPVTLIEGGVPRAFIYDLETATHAGVAPTGHGVRSIFGKPRASYSNLLVRPGEQPLAVLIEAMADGLVVDELIGVGQGNVASGAFSHPVALAYRVVRGEYTGRVKDAAVAGHAFELLRRVGGVSREARWLGAKRLPWILLEGVSVAKR